MSENKMRKLFASARNEAPAEPGPDFPAQVMRAVHREPSPGVPSVLGQLGDLFPRLAIAAAVLIALCVAADFCASAIDQSDLTGGAAQLSEQWLFATKGF